MTGGGFQLASKPLPSSPGLGMSSFSGILAGLPLLTEDLTAYKIAKGQILVFKESNNASLLILPSPHRRYRNERLFVFLTTFS